MTWVLILTPSMTAQPPAVIGGYAERATAEAAGFAATEFAAGYGPSPAYQRFTVIPGAASSEVIGSTHSVTERYLDQGYVIARTTWRDGQEVVREQRVQPWP